MRMQGKSVVVTGASSGMGDAIVRRFVAEGAQVVAVARRKERLEALQAALANEPGSVEIYPGDVSDQTLCEGMIDFAVEKFGKLDVLVNNAGIMDDMSPIGDVENERLERVFQVNTFGPLYAMRKAVNVFLEQGRGGAIVNVASLGAMRSCAGAVYCASKAAVVSMTKNTAYMYMKDSIRANAIAPGGIASEIASSMGQPNPNGYGRIQPVLACGPEPGSTEEIANAALFLASDESKYISGDVLIVDGGWNAG